ncbi:MAG: bifunctional phosphoglucose/phosphomannose isomerase [Dehalococcoidia bacterium]|nr:bifunctional phosphoglucose/phosphomannose isomerase [Chloroflexi bacterium CFX7]MCK6563661.1 bifunctional phosphoglucose/phosphomannose isomerase [Dehalococcoidia bacterium]NUQ55055.1 bifunctional phosphoglucose/phosphomannose isomerase [Dehalococcoidia bacterium]RIL03646.1 MAG: bifunctional phosphoglucose/phosphomannose isomerase [bacterium]
MSRLDDRGLLALDASGMLDHAAALGVELLKGWEAAEGLGLPPATASIGSVVIAGMGGSATSGDYFASLCEQSAELPVAVTRGYALPNFVTGGTLVVVSSYSGNTEESLSCYDDAWKRGATILAITRGGQLAERANGDGVPVFTLTYQAAPRAALPHSLAPLLRLGAMLGLVTLGRDDIAAAATLHDSLVTHDLGTEVPEARNPAKQLAQALAGRVPFILGAEHLAPVATRFKNQVAENGKMLAAADHLPEADHNLIVGLATATAAGASVSLVTLESALYDERTARRFAITRQLFEEAGVPVHRINVAGQRTLDQMVAGTAWGDFVSCYLALLNGYDPSPVPQIDRLKAALTG